MPLLEIKLLRKGAEIVAVGVKVFPPGNAVAGCIFYLETRRGTKNHVAGICDTTHSGEHALLRAVNLRLVCYANSRRQCRRLRPRVLTSQYRLHTRGTES